MNKNNGKLNRIVIFNIWCASVSDGLGYNDVLPAGLRQLGGGAGQRQDDRNQAKKEDSMKH